LRNFSLDRNGNTMQSPKPTDKIVYYQASCDLFHPGVISRIKKAKAMGDYLYVGLWSDEMVQYYQGENYPLMSMQERALMLLACKYVDDIVIEAPYIITEDLVKSLSIEKVVNVISDDDRALPQHQDVDQFTICKKLGIYEEVAKTEGELTVEEIC